MRTSQPASSLFRALRVALFALAGLLAGCAGPWFPHRPPSTSPPSLLRPLQPPTTNSSTEAQARYIEGIVFNETSGVYPALKPGLTPGGPQNWDSASEQALHDARVHIAEIANAGKHRMAPSRFPEERGLTPIGEAQLADVQSAVADANGRESADQFVIWPSKDGGRTPDQSVGALAPWTTQTERISRSSGPFRIPVQVGDTPAGDKIYIFFYSEMK